MGSSHCGVWLLSYYTWTEEPFLQGTKKRAACYSLWLKIRAFELACPVSEAIKIDKRQVSGSHDLELGSTEGFFFFGGGGVPLTTTWIGSIKKNLNIIWVLFIVLSIMRSPQAEKAVHNKKSLN